MTSQQKPALHGLVFVPSTPTRRQASAGTSVRKGGSGWRSIAAHWLGLCLLALVTVVALLQVTGLRPGQGLLAFRAQPGGSFLLPTPTPRPPTPTPKRLPAVPPGSGQVVSIIQSVFGPYADAAVAVARCESGLNPSAVNPTPIGGSHATGLFQILYPSTWSTTSQAGNSPYDAQANTRAAYDIFKRDGYSWREWACKP
jgi:hypothetical protein